MTNIYSRRQVLSRTAMLLACTGLSSCCLTSRHGFSGHYDPPVERPVRVDAHTHIFNIRDLPARGVAEFLVETHLFRPIGEPVGAVVRALVWILESIGTVLTPDYWRETAHLDRVLGAQTGPALETDEVSDEMLERAVDAALRGRDLPPELAAHRDESRRVLEGFYDYAGERTGRTQKYAGQPELLSPPNQAEFEDALEALGEGDVLEARREADTDQNKSFGVVLAVAAFVAGVLYRKQIATALRSHLGNARKLISIFGEDRRDIEAIDLFVAADVDMDLWANQEFSVGKNDGRQTQELLEKTALATDGRILPFAAFDPLREAVERHRRVGDPQSDGSLPLDLVKKAILEQGFVGVKLYPPMGFKPIGNGALDSVPGHPWPRAAQGIPEIGAKMDAALIDLYAFCLCNDVPIMAHANRSFYSNRAYADFPAPANWQTLLDAENEALFGDGTPLDIRQLRLNLGHLNRADTVPQYEGSWIEQAAHLIGPDNRIYADLANFDKIGRDAGQANVRRNLDRLVTDQPAARNRIMFGTDWWMIATYRHLDRYVADQQRATAAVLGRTEFFGRNSLEFLGLVPGAVPWARLRRYYRTNPHKPIQPPWIARVERQFGAVPDHAEPDDCGARSEADHRMDVPPCRA